MLSWCNMFKLTSVSVKRNTRHTNILSLSMISSHYISFISKSYRFQLLVFMIICFVNQDMCLADEHVMNFHFNSNRDNCALPDFNTLTSSQIKQALTGKVELFQVSTGTCSNDGASEYMKIGECTKSYYKYIRYKDANCTILSSTFPQTYVVYHKFCSKSEYGSYVKSICLSHTTTMYQDKGYQYFKENELKEYPFYGSQASIINEYDISKSYRTSVVIPACYYPKNERIGKVLEFITSDRYYGDVVNGKRYKFKCNSYNGTERADMVGYDAVSGTVSETIQLGYYNVCSKLPVITYTDIIIAPTGAYMYYNTIINVKCQNINVVIPVESPKLSSGTPPKQSTAPAVSSSSSSLPHKSFTNNGNSYTCIGHYYYYYYYFSIVLTLFVFC